MALVLDWCKKLGYKRDPFSIETPAYKVIIGRKLERDRINAFLIKGFKFGTITGDAGLGKTLLLRWLEEGLNMQRKIYHLFLNPSKIKGEDALVKRMIHASMNIFQEMLITLKKETSKEKYDYNKYLKILRSRISRRQFILIIDNSSKLSKKQTELIKMFMQYPKFQVIASETEIKKIPIKEKDALKIKLKPYTAEELKAMVSRRIRLAEGYKIFPFDNKLLGILAKKAKGFPKDMLNLSKSKAIDLSLKVKAPPVREEERQEENEKRDVKSEKKQKEKKENIKAISKKTKKDDINIVFPFLKIKIVKDDEDVDKREKSKKRRKDKPNKEYVDEQENNESTLSELTEDEKLLAKIVNETSIENHEERDITDNAKDDEVIIDITDNKEKHKKEKKKHR